MTLYSGSRARAKANKGGPKDRVWTLRFIWNNNGDAAALVSPDGETVSNMIRGMEREADAVEIANGRAKPMYLKGWKLVSSRGGHVSAASVAATTHKHLVASAWVLC